MTNNSDVNIMIKRVKYNFFLRIYTHTHTMLDN